MKKIFLLSLLSLLILIFACSKSVEPEQALPGQNLADLNSNHQDESKTALCCNFHFPDSGNKWDCASSIIWCEGEPEDFDLICLECARIWAEYNNDPNHSLRYQACGGDIPDNIPDIESLYKSADNNHPRLIWSFKYCHRYIVERKIGSGDFEVLATIENRNQTNFVDDEINLIKHPDLWYRVFAEIWS